jgi:membrane associated rhomboid family serine protease
VTPWVTRLLVANIGMFFLQSTMGGIERYLMFVPRLAFVQPWTILTYMFLHGGLGHLFFNMLSLYFFGPQVEARLGSRRFITLYLISGVTGALLSFFFSPNAAIIGASGAVFGVMLAFAHFWPRERIMIWGIIPVEARMLVIGMTVISLFSGARGGGSIAHYAHLGGYLGAFLYLRWLDNRAGAKSFRRKTTPVVADRSLDNWKRIDVRSVHEVNRDEVNRILDKINASGMGSLTPQERAFLANFVPTEN